ncbi:hypothetical protein TKK_0015573 [Trichogramma kaykai]|uniref:Uncharacterized protein n=2 Tax=Trichogramma kaykai TaxID=54128 RepID=A0ABD2WA28_9HYME
MKNSNRTADTDDNQKHVEQENRTDHENNSEIDNNPFNQINDSNDDTNMLNDDIDDAEKEPRILFDSDMEDSYSDYESLYDDVQPKDLGYSNDDRIMFSPANYTVSDVVMMLKAIIIKFNPTKKMQEALIGLIKTLAGKEFDCWTFNPYRAKKQLNPPADTIKKHFFCVKCDCPLLSIESSKKVDTVVKCSLCNEEVILSSSSKNFFITLDLKYQLQMLLNGPDIQKHMQNFRNKQTCSSKDDTISDIQDSLKYKRLQMRYPRALTFNFNTDGAQLFESAKRSLWPLQLYINELPPEIRFKHLLIAALMESESEPTANRLNLFMETMIMECQHLSVDGVPITDSESGIVQNIIIIPFTANVDTVARPKLQNRIQFNGYDGCSWCYHPGKYCDGSMRYIMLENDAPLRSHEDHLIDLKNALKFNKPIRGVKGESILLALDQFDIVWDLPPDYMHGSLLGVTKQLWAKWSNAYFKKPHLEKIKSRMLHIKLIRDIRRSIRPLEFAGKYKATEWRTWLLFLSLPVLKDILPEDEFLSFSKFVSSVYELLKEKITDDDLRKVEYNLLNFTGQSEIDYYEGFITFNVHSLNHYCHAVKHCGPFWSTSAFPFENGSFEFMREINAPNGCLRQISEKWLRKNAFEAALSQIPPHKNDTNRTLQYCKNLFSAREPLKKCTIVIMNPTVSSDNKPTNIVNSFDISKTHTSTKLIETPKKTNNKRKNNVRQPRNKINSKKPKKNNEDQNNVSQPKKATKPKMPNINQTQKQNVVTRKGNKTKNQANNSKITKSMVVQIKKEKVEVSDFHH